MTGNTSRFTQITKNKGPKNETSLVGGFNPCKKKCSSNWIISPIFGMKLKQKKYSRQRSAGRPNGRAVRAMAAKPHGTLALSPIQLQQAWEELQCQIRTGFEFDNHWGGCQAQTVKMPVHTSTASRRGRGTQPQSTWTLGHSCNRHGPPRG